MTTQRRGSLDGPGLALLIDQLTEPSPASHVRIVLREYRRRGYGFEYAWAQALRSLPRTMPEGDEWRLLLHRGKERWRGAYEGAPTERESDPLALAQ